MTLATFLFTDHEEYGVLIAGAKKASAKKAQELWVLKVKNQLTRLVH